MLNLNLEHEVNLYIPAHQIGSKQERYQRFNYVNHIPELIATNRIRCHSNLSELNYKSTYLITGAIRNSRWYGSWKPWYPYKRPQDKSPQKNVNMRKVHKKIFFRRLLVGFWPVGLCPRIESRLLLNVVLIDELT